MMLAACLQNAVILGAPGYEVGFACFVKLGELLDHCGKLNCLFHILRRNHAEVHGILCLLGEEFRLDEVLDAAGLCERLALKLDSADFDNLREEAARTANGTLIGGEFVIYDEKLFHFFLPQHFLYFLPLPQGQGSFG